MLTVKCGTVSEYLIVLQTVRCKRKSGCWSGWNIWRIERLLSFWVAYISAPNIKLYFLLLARVEAGSNTSTVTLRVVGGDEKGSLKTETVKYDREIQGSKYKTGKYFSIMDFMVHSLQNLKDIPVTWRIRSPWQQQVRHKKQNISVNNAPLYYHRNKWKTLQDVRVKEMFLKKLTTIQ
jgi:hypothetical protein